MTNSITFYKSIAFIYEFNPFLKTNFKLILNKSLPLFVKHFSVSFLKLVDVSLLKRILYKINHSEINKNKFSEFKN